MQNGIDINEVKKYNATLKQYRDQAARVHAEIEFNERELREQCAELSKELGFEVTPDNLETILQDRITKINSTMQIGNEILKRIREEEERAKAGSIGSV